MPKKIIDTSSYDQGTKEKPAIIKAPKKRITQDVKKKSESKKPVKKKWETRIEKKEEILDAWTSENDIPKEWEIEYSQDRKGNLIVTQQAYKPARSYNLWGRPTKYKEEYADMLLDYFSSFTQEIYVDREYYDIKGRTREETIERTPIDEDGYKRHLVRKETHKVISSKFPTIERFAFMIDVSRITLHDWATAVYDEKYHIVEQRGKLKHPRFSYAYARAREIQEGILIEGAMDWTFNSQFAIFLAKNRFGYTDKTEVEQTSVGVIWVVWLPEEKRNALEYLIASKIKK